MKKKTMQLGKYASDYGYQKEGTVSQTFYSV